MAASLWGKMKKWHIDINHTQESIGQGHQPAGQVEGDQRQGKLG
jgi:hypothetical protein